MRALRGVGLIAVACLASVLGLGAWALRDVPWAEIAEGSLKPVVVLQTAEGQQLVSQGPYQGAYAMLGDFPGHLVDAVISAEDRRFHEHPGIDPRASPAHCSGTSGRLGRRRRQHDHQRLIKILYLESDRTLKRKIQEAVIALWLEQKLGKDEILVRYLNNVYLGAGATGMPAAARVYFGKELGEARSGGIGHARRPHPGAVAAQSAGKPQGAARATEACSMRWSPMGSWPARRSGRGEIASAEPARPSRRCAREAGSPTG